MLTYDTSAEQYHFGETDGGYFGYSTEVHVGTTEKI